MKAQPHCCSNPEQLGVATFDIRKQDSSLSGAMFMELMSNIKRGWNF